MPVCFTLTRKGASDPSVMQSIDEELCQHLGVPVDDALWVADWYNLIGFRLATGTPLDSHDLDDLASASHTSKHLPAILSYLRTHFDADCWREVGRFNKR